MPQKSHYTLLLMMFILIGTSFNVTQVQGVDIWTAHVKWVGYDFLSDNDCGDGYAGACENKLKVKRTTSTSCSSRSWTEGVEKSNYPSAKYLNGYYEITWFRVGSAPCLTFDARILENNAGYSTNQVTKTINSYGGHYTTNMGLILGSANGYFKIEYWVVHTTIYD